MKTQSSPLPAADIHAFCSILEQILRPHGLHVALTGSFLYGMGTGKDVSRPFACRVMGIRI